MKNRIIVIIIFAAITSFVFSQTEIEMEKVGGVFRLPCTINGAKMKMIFDTGATNVSMSSSIAQYLIDNDYLSSSDFNGIEQVQIADGTITDNLVVNIRDLGIGGLHLKNVRAWVSSELDAPLLFGQSAIQKLGPITISRNKLILKSDNDLIAEMPQFRNCSSDSVTIMFRGSPIGVDVKIDSIQMGNSIQEMKLTPGIHSFTLSQKNYCSETFEMEIPSDQNYYTVTYLLDIKIEDEVIVYFHGSPDLVDIFIDGTYQGTKYCPMKLKPGIHEVTLKQQNKVCKTMKIRVPDNSFEYHVSYEL